jgi:hypothetical protein
VFIPACVVERLGPIESLNRSSNLTKGCRWKISVLYLLCFVIGVAFGVTFAFISGAFMSGFNPIFLAVFEQLSVTIPMTFVNVLTAVTYYELRNVKEGVTIDSLANVFD